MNPWKVILATMVIFACGVVTGALITKNWNSAPALAALPSPAPTNSHSMPMFGMQRPEFLRRLQRQLDLTPDQRAAIEKLIKASHGRTQVLWEQIAPQMNAELKRVRDEIRLVLTPEQRKRWAELTKRHKAESSEPPSFPRASPQPQTTNSL